MSVFAKVGRAIMFAFSIIGILVTSTIICSIIVEARQTAELKQQNKHEKPDLPSSLADGLNISDAARSLKD